MFSCSRLIHFKNKRYLLTLVFLYLYLTPCHTEQPLGSILHESRMKVKPVENNLLERKLFSWTLNLAHRETGVRHTCMEICQGQEWGIASSPLTILGVAVLGFTAGFPLFTAQSGERKHTNYNLYNLMVIMYNYHLL